MHLMGVYHRMQPFCLSRTYVFAAFGGRWPGVAFLILALSVRWPECQNRPPYPPHSTHLGRGPNLLVPQRKLASAPWHCPLQNFQKFPEIFLFSPSSVEVYIP